MAEEKIDNALGEVKNIMENKREDWVCHSQAIAATMSDRMEELGMTQRVLAEKMNCTQQYVSKVLKGRENLSLETLCKIENALGIKILQARINSSNTIAGQEYVNTKRSGIGSRTDSHTPTNGLRLCPDCRGR